MSALLSLLKSQGATQARLLAGPVLIVLVLGMMVLPLPTFLLDLLFTFNIALSVMILLVAMFTRKPLDFAAFPSVLLFATLLRLSLNVASTRVVLLHGHEGPSAAGKVIEAFGHFLVGGNFAVGIIVFVILTIINFIVITKGAGRIAEVGARFTLDAMPGKQMAIDADLNAGLIGEEDARRRRGEVAQEADFFGSMDGASKFVRGDAIAGLLIMVINVIGGLIVGLAQHDLSFAESGRVYTLLTIGDGLVAQIPALVISTAAGVVVSRVSNDQDVGQQIVGQLFANPNVMFLTAIIIGIMGLIPNMPHLAFLTLAAALGGAGWMVLKRQRAQAAPDHDAPSQAAQAQAAAAEASWEDVSMVDPLGLEVGYRLIPLVDHAQSGELLHRIRSLRKKFAQDVGFLPAVVHIRDNLELKPNDYRILLSGVEVGRGVAMPGQWLAIDPGGVNATIKGVPTTDPAFGLPALWIDNAQRDPAQVAGYTVVDASTVVATHLNHLMHRHGASLLGRQETQQLLDRVGRESPKLVEDFVPKTLSLTALQKVLQGLLSEEVPIRDMRTIIDTLAEHAPRLTVLAANTGGQPDVPELIALTRRALGRAITQQWFPGEGELCVIGLDVKLERVLSQAMATSGGLEPGLAETLLRETEAAVVKQESQGNAPVLLVSPPLRAPLARFLRHHLPQLGVLSNAEIPDERIVRVTALVGGMGE